MNGSEVNWEKVYEESFQRNSKFVEQLIKGGIKVEAAIELLLTPYETPSRMKVYLFKGEPVLFEHDPLNHFVIDNSGYLRWHSLSSNFEKVKRDNVTITNLIKDSDFHLDAKDGFIRVIPVTF